MALTGEQLMQRFVSGDDSAFADLVERYKPQAVEFATHILGNRESAEDAVQEAFFRVFRAKESYHPSARFSTWLYTIITNLCTDELRKRRRQVSLESLLGQTFTPDHPLLAGPIPGRPAQERPDSLVERKELTDMLRRAIDTLSAEHQEIITLRIHGDLGYAEIAEKLGCSVGTAKSRMHYAIKRLRETLMNPM